MRVNVTIPLREEPNPMSMARADLHVHSMYSEPPSGWLMRTAHIRESYTDLAHVYRLAKERGMTFVTVTDHNCIDGALLLKERYPDEAFTGVEATARFPEDGCTVHVLIYGLTEADFQEVQRLRADIYALREFVKERGLAHSVAHAAYAVNGRLSISHLERLILLFDTFEVINGGRGRADNITWERALRSLTPYDIEVMYRKYRIEPFSQTPWIKGFTGGSDDHAGLFVGRTFTVAQTSTVDEFLQTLMRKTTYADGCYGDFRSLAFSVGKVALDYSWAESRKARLSLQGRVAHAVLENKPLPLDARLAIRLAKATNGRLVKDSRKALLQLADGLGQVAPSRDARLDAAYHSLASFCDEAIVRAAQSLSGGHQGPEKSGERTNGVLKDLKALAPAALAVGPFLGTLAHMHKGRELLAQIEGRFKLGQARRPQRVLCFLDTADMGEVLDYQSRLSGCWDDDAWVMVSADADETEGGSLPRVLRLPAIAHLELPTGKPLPIPSLLRSLEQIASMEPDEIHLATPGPVGLVGLLASKLLGVRCVATYNMEFLQALMPRTDAAATAAMEKYVNWFYSAADEIDAPVADSEWAHADATEAGSVISLPAHPVRVHLRYEDTRVPA